MSLISHTKGRLTSPGMRDTQGDRLNRYIGRIDQVLAGSEECVTTPTFTTLVAGWRTAEGNPLPIAQHRLNEAVRAGHTDDIGSALLDAALCHTQDVHAVRDDCAREIMTDVRTAYSDTARRNYDAIAKKWNAAAAELRACADVVALSAPADEVVRSSGKVQKAWTSAEPCGREVERLTPILIEAAALAGVTIASDLDVLGLTVPLDSDKPAVWDGTHKPHRCGVWGSLAEQGVRLRALGNLDAFEPFER